jgi:hypothetical protein
MQTSGTGLQTPQPESGQASRHQQGCHGMHKAAKLWTRLARHEQCVQGMHKFGTVAKATAWMPYACHMGLWPRLARHARCVHGMKMASSCTQGITSFQVPRHDTGLHYITVQKACVPAAAVLHASWPQPSQASQRALGPCRTQHSTA